MWSELKGQRCSQQVKDIPARAALVLVAALSLAAAGCGAAQNPDRLPVFPTSGKITFKGAVPDGAYIALHSKTKAKAPNGQEVIPTAQVRSDGTFDFSSYAAKDGRRPVNTKSRPSGTKPSNLPVAIRHSARTCCRRNTARPTCRR